MILCSFAVELGFGSSFSKAPIYIYDNLRGVPINLEVHSDPEKIGIAFIVIKTLFRAEEALKREMQLLIICLVMSFKKLGKVELNRKPL
jgi:hypothetical protein